ncbi:MAG: PEP-CTERM sorting domain-containing protein [Pirellulales bacterium]|nr:PEP-CTERM sorting domain-containing protein [Pirellulales bacterium]
MKCRTALALGCVALALGLARARADVTADFDSLNSVLDVDAFPGIPGDGWSTEWREYVNATSPNIVTTVVSEGTAGYAPLFEGGGPYLSATIAENATDDVRYALAREHASEGVDMTSPHRIEFTIRIDEDVDSVLSTFTTYRDRYMIFDGPAGANTASSQSTWQVFAYAGAGNMAPENVVKEWSFLNGANSPSGTIDASMAVDTDVPIVTGGVYAFTIDNYPDAGLWSGSVAMLGTGYSFSKKAMGWRDSQANGSYLYFSTRSSGLDDVPPDYIPDDTRAFSLDAIRISPIAPLTPPGNLTTVAAHFDGGNTDAVVDAYRGRRGAGWNDAWTFGGSNAASTAQVVSPGKLGFDELKPGQSGAYLQVVNDHGAATSYAGVRRSYEAFDEGIDWSRDHTVRFSLRIDEDLALGFNHGDDRYQISDLNAGRFNSDASATWIVTCFGGVGDFAEADDVGVWVFYDGGRDGAGRDAALNVPSTVPVITGEVYDFVIEVDAGTRSYVATVSNDAYGSFRSGSLGWRSAADMVGGYLLFDTRSNEAGEQRAFSLDSVVIAQASRPGDANNDGRVDALDAAIVARNWLGDASGGAGAGDFNADGRVDDLDLAILAANWQGDVGAANVPEPGMLVLLAGGLVLVMWKNRRG